MQSQKGFRKPNGMALALINGAENRSADRIPKETNTFDEQPGRAQNTPQLGSCK